MAPRKHPAAAARTVARSQAVELSRSRHGRTTTIAYRVGNVYYRAQIRRDGDTYNATIQPVESPSGAVAPVAGAPFVKVAEAVAQAISSLAHTGGGLGRAIVLGLPLLAIVMGLMLFGLGGMTRTLAYVLS